ncbi:MAG TPA: hypothetical protein VJN01_10975, partial [Xanthomonadales bacterium]|nr:hypothetical protein [Xanthomonadales bacterium]
MKRCAAVLLFFPLSCFAVDGVYEINQLCVDSGCFNGDSAGWPVTLAQTGSYRLTSNLDVSGHVTAAEITAIHITAPGVSLDLNGFSVKGPQSGGTGDGINSTAVGTSISNGHVTAMGNYGIRCGENCRIDRVSATLNSFTGIEMWGMGGVLTNSASIGNGSIGVNTAGTVKNCVINGNGNNGVNAGTWSMVEGNQVIANSNNGIHCSGCSAVNNVVAENGGTGIYFADNASFGGNRI